jgi:hypothetical protein
MVEKEELCGFISSHKLVEFMIVFHEKECERVKVKKLSL